MKARRMVRALLNGIKWLWDCLKAEWEERKKQAACAHHHLDLIRHDICPDCGLDPLGECM